MDETKRQEDIAICEMLLQHLDPKYIEKFLAWHHKRVDETTADTWDAAIRAQCPNHFDDGYKLMKFGSLWQHVITHGTHGMSGFMCEAGKLHEARRKGNAT